MKLKLKLIDNEIRLFPLSRTDIKEDLVIEDSEYDLLVFEANETNSELKIENGKLVIKYNLEKLKELKKEDLKKARQNYKKTQIIKNGFSVLDFEPYDCYNYFNLKGHKAGFTQEDENKFNEIIDVIIEKYDNYKNQIKQAKNKEELDKIQFTF